MQCKIALSGIDSNREGFSGDVTGGTRVTFSSVDMIRGSGSNGANTLHGIDIASSWILGRENSYTVGDQVLQFSMVEDVQGGSMADTFTVDGPHTGNIRGGAGADIFTISSRGSATGSITGGSGDDSFAIRGSVNGNIDGGIGNDSFAFNGGSVSGTVSGGVDSDSLNFASIAKAVRIVLSGTDNAGFSGRVRDGATVAFSGVDVITGSSSNADTLQGLDIASSWILGMEDSYTAGDKVLRFSMVEDMQGGSEADTFTVNGTHRGNLSGGAGDDTFSLDAGGSVSGTINGGADSDVFNIGSIVTGSLSGGNGADTFNMNAGGMVTGIVDGGAGTDIFILR